MCLIDIDAPECRMHWRPCTLWSVATAALFSWLHAVTAQTSPKLSDSGWSASASTAAAGYPASNVLGTAYSSYWQSTDLPASITIDMQLNYQITDFEYVPRSRGKGTEVGRILDYAVCLSLTSVQSRAMRVHAPVPGCCHAVSLHVFCVCLCSCQI